MPLATLPPRGGHGPMITRMVVQTTLWLAAMGAILFLAAGDWRWPQGWVFLSELGLSSLAVSFWLLRHDPAFLESRLSAPVRRDQMPWDRIFMLVVGESCPICSAIDSRADLSLGLLEQLLPPRKRVRSLRISGKFLKVPLQPAMPVTALVRKRNARRELFSV